MGKKRSKPITDEQILSSYDEHRSAFKVARVLGIGATTIYRALNRYGVERTGLDDYRRRIKKFQGQEVDISKMYESGMTLDAIRQKVGAASDYAIKHAIRRAGGTFRVNPAPTMKDGELETIRELHDSGLGQMQISLKLGRSQSFVSRAMRKFGIATHKPRWETHGNWKGGRMKAGDYVRVKITNDDSLHSMANNAGYVLEHRLVMARMLDRPLLETESVHHINGNTTDNRIENLQLRQGRHGKHIVLGCLDCGSQRIGPMEIADPDEETTQ